MWVILDDQTKEHMEQDSRGYRHMLQMASFVVLVHEDDTYEILKDRYRGEHAESFPLEYLPEELKQRLCEVLRYKDGVDFEKEPDVRQVGELEQDS